MFRKTKTFIALAWLIFLIKGLINIAITPIWEAFDEPYHFGYIQHLAEHKTLPVVGKSFLSKEVAASLYNSPLPEALVRAYSDVPCFSHETYWKQPREKIDELSRQAASSPVDYRKEEERKPVLSIYQAHHPPLYFLSMTPVYWLFSKGDILQRVFAIRIASVLLASLSVPVAFAISRLFEDRFFRVGVPLVMVFMPALYIDVAKIGNEGLGVLFYSLLMYLSIRFLQGSPTRARSLLLGVVLSLGFLTKVYFWLALPVVAFLVIRHSFRRGTSRALLHNLLLLILPSLVVSAWWYLRAAGIYGSSFFILQGNYRMEDLSLGQRVATFFAVPWITSLKVFFVSHLWVGNWSLLSLPVVFSYLALLVFLLAAIGLGIEVVKVRTRSAFSQDEMAAIRTLGLFLGVFALGLIYHRYNDFARLGNGGGTGGWYLYPLVTAEVTLVLIGLRRILPQLWRPPMLICLVLALIVTDWVGIAGCLVPYYTGLAPMAQATGSVDFDVLWQTPFIEAGRTALSRLPVNKPAYLGSSSYVILIVAYLACSLWCLSAAIQELRASPEQRDEQS